MIFFLIFVGFFFDYEELIIYVVSEVFVFLLFYEIKVKVYVCFIFTIFLKVSRVFRIGWVYEVCL